MKTTINFESKLIGLTIPERNKVFNSLSEEDKRKEIAYDCLQLILAEKLLGGFRHYWGSNLMKIKLKTTIPEDFQKTLNNINNTCSVCVRGGMMLSQIRLGNELSPEDPNAVDGVPENIKGFSYDDFQKMECEYEEERYGHPYDNNTTEKLANICCNVIANGNFNIEDKTDYLILHPYENSSN